MSVLETTEPPPAPPAPPEPFLVGSFAAYQHQGGIVVAWRKKGEETERHLPIPAVLIKMAAAQAGKTPEEVIAELMGLAQ